jgi:hypothetical protein
MTTYYAIVNVENRRLGTYVAAANIGEAFVAAAAKYKRRYSLRHVETIAVQPMADDYKDVRLVLNSTP